MNDGQKDCIAGENALETKPQLDVKEALLLKRKSLIREVMEIDADISQVQEEYHRKLDDLQGKKKQSEEALKHVDALLRLEGHATEISKDMTNSAKLAMDAAFSLLGELRQPMHYKDIAKKLQEQEIYIPGQDPAATLLSRMSRDPRFKRIMKRGTYALSTWRVRAAKSKRKAKTKKRM